MSERKSGSPSNSNRSAEGERKSGVRPKPPKKELGIDSPPEEKLAALKSAAEYFNSDLTQIICRDDNDKLLSVSVHAKGEYARRFELFLKRLDAEEKAGLWPSKSPVQSRVDPKEGDQGPQAIQS